MFSDSEPGKPCGDIQTGFLNEKDLEASLPKNVTELTGERSVGTPSSNFPKAS